MQIRSTWALSAVILMLAVGATTTASAQVDPRDVPIVAQPQQRFDSGQDVQPIFEGWTRNEDGSFLFHFGYLNRNYREQPSIPIGPNNYFSPGAEDRGQPTYFYPRSQRYTFTVRVPADMGTTLEDGLVWTVTHHGSAQKAVGWLQPEWEIDENTIASNGRTGFGRSKIELYANEPPAVTVSATRATVAVGQPLTVTAVITDDELPTEIPPRGNRRFRTPALVPPEGAPTTPDNIEWYRKPQPPRNGLSVAWIVYRGPADAAVAPPGFLRAVAEDEGQVRRRGYYAAIGPLSNESQSLEGDGWTSATFEARVTFTEPGSYTLRAYACDAMAMTPADVTVTVTERTGE